MAEVEAGDDREEEEDEEEDMSGVEEMLAGEGVTDDIVLTMSHESGATINRGFTVCTEGAVSLNLGTICDQLL